MLLLGAAFQSCNVAMILGLFAWTGNIYVFVIAEILSKLLTLLSDRNREIIGKNTFDIAFISCLVPCVVLLIVLLWRIEKQLHQTETYSEGKNYILNFYFLFAIIQSFNYCVSDSISSRILQANELKEQ